jgi:hypothetical protein
VFLPSKGLFVSLSWNSQNFIYASVGSKIFKILTSSVEGMRILDTSPEVNLYLLINIIFEGELFFSE